jgi:hypothetical protein
VEFLRALNPFPFADRNEAIGWDFVIEVAECTSAARVLSRNAGPGLFNELFEPALSEAAE